MPTFEMALLRVGLGAVLFAPKRRFMLDGFFYKIEVERLVVVCRVVGSGVVRRSCWRIRQS